jgi:hypothetical protein
MGAKNREGIGLSYRPARLHYRLAEFVPLESIPGLNKRLKIPPQNMKNSSTFTYFNASLYVNLAVNKFIVIFISAGNMNVKRL